MDNSKDKKVLTNPVDYRFDLLDAKALMAMARVMHEGSKDHHEGGWKQIEVSDHLNHTMGHIIKWRMKERDEDHLAHAMCRMMMAWAVNHMNEPVVDALGPTQSRRGMGDHAMRRYGDAKVQQQEAEQPPRKTQGILPGREILYLCYPYADDPERRRRIITYLARHIQCTWSTRSCPLVLVPHLMFQHLKEKPHRDLVLQLCVAAVTLCDTLVVIGDHISDGMEQEIDAAERMGKNIVDYSDKVGIQKMEEEDHKELMKGYQE